MGKKADSTTAMHKCPICGDKLMLERYNGTATPPFPQGWWLDAVHSHSEDETVAPVWKTIVYYRQAGGRFPPGAKDIRAEVKANRAEAVARRRVEKDSLPGRSGG